MYIPKAMKKKSEILHQEEVINIEETHVLVQLKYHPVYTRIETLYTMTLICTIVMFYISGKNEF